MTKYDLVQDWDEIEALRESLREHMSEIHRLRAELAENALQRLTDVHQEIEATSQESKQVEPVAWMWEETAPRSSTGIGGIDRKLLFCRPADEPWKRNITPLYTAPLQRKPLTHEEIKSMWGITEYREFAIDFARAIELAHGIGDA